MAAPKFIVTHTDGRVEVVKMLPKAQVTYEREKKRSLRDEAKSLTELYEYVWYACGKPAPFDEFIDTLESVEADSEEIAAEEGGDPLPPTLTDE